MMPGGVIRKVDQRTSIGSGFRVTVMRNTYSPLGNEEGEKRGICRKLWGKTRALNRWTQQRTMATTMLQWLIDD